MRARHALAVTVVGATVLGLRGLAVAPVGITSGSMAPTLSRGDTVLVDRLTPRWRAVSRSDVVVFTSPEDGRDTVKRVVAVEGQSVELRDGVLHVDGSPVVEPQVDLSRIDGVWFGPVRVAEDSVFVLGDARSGSIDSRTYGSVPLVDVQGRVVAILPW